MTDVAGLLEQIPDPELPFLSIADLGILRGFFAYGTQARVLITPTYSGCPALDSIREDIVAVLTENGFDDVEVETVLSPPWTTDWITEKGRAMLAEHGIAPPGPREGPVSLPFPELSASRAVPATREADKARLQCPQCGSTRTEELSRFGSTACKALHRCLDCREPFDRFKQH